MAISKQIGSHLAVLGGGNGTSRLLAALLPLLKDKKIASLHALVHMADDGGSTGRLREQYGVAAMGDLTKCLMALSGFHGDIRGEELLKAMEYRFVSGDFRGHTLRNIFLASLEKTTNLDAAIAMMARILQAPKYAGVVPTTLTTLTQQVYISFDGVHNFLGEGQHSISHRVNLQADPHWHPGDVKVTFAEGDVALNPRAEEVLQTATHVIIAPGHTYGTILPTLALPALARAIKARDIKVIVVMTLLTTPRQTHGWTGEDFVRVYESYLGRPVDVVIGNSHELQAIELVSGQEWVKFNEPKHAYEFIEADLLSDEKPKKQDGDVVPRAMVVHDSAKVRSVLQNLIM